MSRASSAADPHVMPSLSLLLDIPGHVIRFQITKPKDRAARSRVEGDQ